MLKRLLYGSVLLIMGAMMACLSGCPLSDLFPGPVVYYGPPPGT